MKKLLASLLTGVLLWAAAAGPTKAEALAAPANRSATAKTLDAAQPDIKSCEIAALAAEGARIPFKAVKASKSARVHAMQLVAAHPCPARNIFAARTPGSH